MKNNNCIEFETYSVKKEKLLKYTKAKKGCTFRWIEFVFYRYG